MREPIDDCEAKPETLQGANLIEMDCMKTLGEPREHAYLNVPREAARSIKDLLCITWERFCEEANSIKATSNLKWILIKEYSQNPHLQNGTEKENKKHQNICLKCTSHVTSKNSISGLRLNFANSRKLLAQIPTWQPKLSYTSS